MTRLTIGILTLNEERRIEACIRSCSFADQIVVVDSGSKDRTVEIAKGLGAEVFVYPDWQGFAEQRNRMLQHVRGDYILFIDADEEVPADLRAEVQAAVASGQDAVWKVYWELVAYGRPLTHMRKTGGVERLFRRASISHFAGVVHEHAQLTPGERPTYKFRARLLHHSRETIHGSLLKLAQYAQLGAAKRAALGKRGGILRGTASAFANFVRLYFVQRGFLCGPEGFLYCSFVALECFYRYVALHYDREHLGPLSKRT